MKGNPWQKSWCQVLLARLGIVGFHLYRAVRATVQVISVFQADMARRRSRRRQRKGMLATDLQTTTEREVTLATSIWPQTLVMDRSDQLWYKEKRLRTDKVGWPVTQFYDDLCNIFFTVCSACQLCLMCCDTEIVWLCIIKLGRNINNLNCILLNRVVA